MPERVALRRNTEQRGIAMSSPRALIYLDTQRTVAPISPLLFGGFAEHMGRCVYEGIYDPASPLADEDGLRTDVLDALRDQGYTIIRYPGGNFLSGYNWLDGIGPKTQRPMCSAKPPNSKGEMGATVRWVSR